MAKLSILEREHQARQVEVAVIAKGLEALGLNNDHILPLIKLYAAITVLRDQAKHDRKLSRSRVYQESMLNAHKSYTQALRQALGIVNPQLKNWREAGEAMQGIVQVARSHRYPTKHLDCFQTDKVRQD